MQYLRIASLLIVGLLPSIVLAQQPMHGMVVSVHDGDTLSVIADDQQRLVIRLAEIDAPELDQPFGAWSKQLLTGLTAGQQVTFEMRGTDRYGRTIADLWTNSMHINHEMVQAGGAWAYRRYVTDKAFLEDEANARQSQRGLWQPTANEAVPPWMWRSRKRTGN